jgi:HAE1 family hydrophobic/amphiphilic exporter-1
MVEDIKKTPGVVDVDSSLYVGKPELSVRLDRPKASDLGVQIADAAEALRLLVGGDQVTTFNEGSEQYEVHLRARAENRTTIDAIGALTVPSNRLGSVPLDNVARFSEGTAPSDINRLGRQRQVTIYANVLPGGSQAEVQTVMQTAFDRVNPAPATAAGSPAVEAGPGGRNFVSRSSCHWCMYISWRRSSSRGSTRSRSCCRCR